jgi:hypothetical protein
MGNIIGKEISKVFFYYYFSLGFYYFSAGYLYCKKIYVSLFDEFNTFNKRFISGNL